MPDPIPPSNVSQWLASWTGRPAPSSIGWDRSSVLALLDGFLHEIAPLALDACGLPEHARQFRERPALRLEPDCIEALRRLAELAMKEGAARGRPYLFLASFVRALGGGRARPAVPVPRVLRPSLGGRTRPFRAR